MVDSSTLLPRGPLRSYLSDTLDLEVTNVEVLRVGLNVVAALSTAERSNAYVLRRPYKLRASDLFNHLETEYAVLEVLDPTAVPTATPVHYCADEDVVGEPFFLTSFVEGEAVGWDEPLPPRFRTPAAREQVASALVDTVAELHSLDTAEFEGVCRRNPPSDQVERTLDRLDAATAVTSESYPTLRRVGEWLRESVPDESPSRLVHGDYKPDNVLLSGTNQPTVAAVLDWETATLGDPRTELGYFLLYWREEGDPVPTLADLDTTGVADAELAHLQRRIDEGFWPFTSAPGSPTRRELVARYEDRTGLAFDYQRFHRTLAAAGLATVWADIDRHAVESGEAATNGLYVQFVATLAERIASGSLPL
jgi:aminoglycoside phosphotransferase (APT) family kinase protein